MKDFTPDLATNSLPPQNIEAEETILGGILFDPNAMAKVVDILPPEAFYVQAHRHIYEAARALYSQGQPIDLMTVGTWLNDHDLSERSGGTPQLLSLLDRTVSAADIERYVPFIIEKYIRRLLISAAKEISELGYDTSKDLDQVLDLAEQKIFRLTQARALQGLVHLSKILVDTFTEIKKFQYELALPGISSGFYDLDALTSGFQRSDLIIIAGRPAMGKTSFALNIAANVAQQQNMTVAIFSLEMSKEQLAMRLLSSEGKVASNRLKSGKATEQDMEPLMKAMGTLSELPIYIDDTGNITVMQIRSEVRRLQAEKKGNVGLILLDYLQLMQGKNSENRVQELSRITRSLKILAREINAPIIALSQLSRGVEQRTNKRPMLSDLRECVTGDTLIFMADAGHYIPVNKLVGQKDFYVLALNDEMKLAKSRCLDVWKTGEKEIFELETQSGFKIKTSANHPFYTIDGWKELQDISVGDFVASARSLPQNKTSSSLKKEEIILLAHIIGDGCFVDRQPIHYTSQDANSRQIVAQCAQKLWDIKPRIIQDQNSENCFHVYLPSPYKLAPNKHHPFINLLNQLNLKKSRSFDKKIPDAIFLSDNQQIAMFIHHLWCTDGGVSIREKGSAKVYYTSSSIQLINGLKSLLLKFGIHSSINVSQKKNYRPTYHLNVTGKTNILKFANNIGIFSEKGEKLLLLANLLSQKNENPNSDVIPQHIWNSVREKRLNTGLTERAFQSAINTQYCGTTLYKSNVSRQRLERVANVLNDESLTLLAQSDIKWERVKSIKYIGKEMTYDIHVEQNHNFVANDLIVHNSGAIEQDADLVIMLYRDEYYNPDSPDQGIAEVIIAKHRNGPTGQAKLIFNPELTQFLNRQGSHD